MKKLLFIVLFCINLSYSENAQMCKTQIFQDLRETADWKDIVSNEPLPLDSKNQCLDLITSNKSCCNLTKLFDYEESQQEKSFLSSNDFINQLVELRELINNRGTEIKSQINESEKRLIQDYQKFNNTKPQDIDSINKDNIKKVNEKYNLHLNQNVINHSQQINHIDSKISESDNILKTKTSNFNLRNKDKFGSANQNIQTLKVINQNIDICKIFDKIIIDKNRSYILDKLYDNINISADKIIPELNDHQSNLWSYMESFKSKLEYDEVVKMESTLEKNKESLEINLQMIQIQKDFLQKEIEYDQKLKKEVYESRFDSIMDQINIHMNKVGNVSNLKDSLDISNRLLQSRDTPLGINENDKIDVLDSFIQEAQQLMITFTNNVDSTVEKNAINSQKIVQTYQESIAGKDRLFLQSLSKSTNDFDDKTNNELFNLENFISDAENQSLLSEFDLYLKMNSQNNLNKSKMVFSKIILQKMNPEFKMVVSNIRDKQMKEKLIELIREIYLQEKRFKKPIRYFFKEQSVIQKQQKIINDYVEDLVEKITDEIKKINELSVEYNNSKKESDAKNQLIRLSLLESKRLTDVEVRDTDLKLNRVSIMKEQIRIKSSQQIQNVPEMFQEQGKFSKSLSYNYGFQELKRIYIILAKQKNPSLNEDEQLFLNIKRIYDIVDQEGEFNNKDRQLYSDTAFDQEEINKNLIFLNDLKIKYKGNLKSVQEEYIKNATSTKDKNISDINNNSDKDESTNVSENAKSEQKIHSNKIKIINEFLQMEFNEAKIRFSKTNSDCFNYIKEFKMKSSCILCSPNAQNYIDDNKFAISEESCYEMVNICAEPWSFTYKVNKALESLFALDDNLGAIRQQAKVIQILTNDVLSYTDDINIISQYFNEINRAEPANRINQKDKMKFICQNLLKVGTENKVKLGLESNSVQDVQNIKGQGQGTVTIISGFDGRILFKKKFDGTIYVAEDGADVVKTGETQSTEWNDEMKKINETNKSRKLKRRNRSANFFPGPKPSPNDQNKTNTPDKNGKSNTGTSSKSQDDGSKGILFKLSMVTLLLTLTLFYNV